MSDGVYGGVTYRFTEDLNGLLIMGPKERERILESVRSQIKIRPGDEKRWEEMELPLVKQLCDDVTVRLKENGDVTIQVSDPALEPVFVALTRGTSWYSSVNLVEAVAQGLVFKT